MELSIIIPVYNVALYLKACLDSVLAQNFQDYEVLCVEDGSTDDSLAILLEYERRFNAIKVIRHSKNMGLSAARNTGIRNAKGKYIQFVDADDMIVPDACRLLYECAERYDADIVYFNMDILNDDARLVKEKQKNKKFEGIYTGVRLFCLYQEARTLKPEAVRHFMKKRFLLDNNLSFYEGIIHEDILFSFYAAMKAERVVDLDRELYLYRQREGSISWGNKEKTAASYFVCLINICSYWMTNEFSSYENKWIAHYIKKLYQSYRFYKWYRNPAWKAFGEKEKLLFEILETDYSVGITFTEEDISKLRMSKMNILYGAGRLAVDVFNTLKRLHIQIDGIAVTDTTGNASLMDGVAVKRIEEYRNCENAIFIIGTDVKYHDEIIKVLSRYRLHEYVRPQIN